MSQWVLKQNDQIVPRCTMRKLTPEELVRDSEIRKMSNFDEAIKEMYGNSLSFPAKRIWKMEASEEEDDVFDLPFDELAPPFLEANITDADGNAMHTTSTADILTGLHLQAHICARFYRNLLY